MPPRLPDVAVSREYKYMCSDPGQELIRQDIQEHSLNRIVVASCSPLMHEPTFRGALAQGRNQPFLAADGQYPRARFVGAHQQGRGHRQGQGPGPRGRAPRGFHKPLEKRRVEINPNVLVVGGGIAGIHAALTLANSGKHVYLVERQPTIGGHMALLRQDLSHARLRRLHPHAQDDGGAARIPTSRCGPIRKSQRSRAMSATTK